MTVGEVIRKTQSNVIVERCGIKGEILFDSETSTFKEYKEISGAVVQRIAPEANGVMLRLKLYVAE